MAKTILGRVMPVDKGTYSSSATYARLDMVHTADSTYVSKVDNNVGHPVTDTNYWQCYADGKQATEAAAAANTAAALANEKAGDAEAAATLANEKAALVQEKLDRADTDHATAASDHTTAASDHTTAQSDHTQAGADHTRAESDHSTATADHTTAGTDHTRAESDHADSESATSAATQAAAAANAMEGRLTSGGLVPALAENLESWAEDVSEVQNSWDETIRSTAGDDPIDTEFGGVLQSIVAETDFKCDALVATPYNQLRLKSNNGGAVALGAGWYFPVPHLELGEFGDATKNNGLILTARDHSNITNAVVRFQPLASGEPTSLSDGVVCAYEDVTYNDETYRTYLTDGEGWLIVSGITWADTCAHLAWEDWYDRFIAPDDPEDVGDRIIVTPVFVAAPNGTGKFLVITSGQSVVGTRADRTDATHMLITDPVARLTTPAWVNTLQEDGETYLHSLTIAAMKSGGVACIEGGSQILTVSGTTISYTDTEPEEISGAVRYELATPRTATVEIQKTAYNLNDCGVEMKEGAEGKAYFVCGYSQNVADALSQIAKVKLNSSLNVVAEALCNLDARTEALEGKAGKFGAVQAETVEAMEHTKYDIPTELWAEGAPAVSVVPSNWPAGKPWDAIPAYKGQIYNDETNRKVYKAFGNSAVSDWIAIN